MNYKQLFSAGLLLMILSVAISAQKSFSMKLKISGNKRYLTMSDGTPFFWLGDTGWLLFTKLSREEAEKYFDDRKQKGFNVILAMVIHDVSNAVNFYGDSALINHRIDQPLTTPGNLPDDPGQYDYWDHIDWLIDIAGKKGLHIGLVPVWGTNIKNGSVTREEAYRFAAWLAERYKNRSNVIWINGGDIKGSDSTDIWNTIGSTIKQISPDQLITFHPRGRTQSSTWFQNEKWLDFNMFQSGHQRYDQDTVGLRYGEDNWRYVNDDYNKQPVKPTLDGEPSYENIPQGLHDLKQPVWKDKDVRRYAYWSVFAGGCGFTYGHNSIMQFHKPGDKSPSYGASVTWVEALNFPGAGQMLHLKGLMLSRPYLERKPCQELIAGNEGEKYDHLVATKGVGYAFIYTYTGRPLTINMAMLDGPGVKASWFDPRTGKYIETGFYKSEGIKEFDPPGEVEEGNDWVLVFDTIVPERQPITNYIPFTGWGKCLDNSNEVIILRKFSRGGHNYYFAADPVTLRTKVISSDSIDLNQTSMEQLNSRYSATPYFKGMKQASINSDTLQDAGITKFRYSQKGINLTVDLCPSQRPLDRIVFTDLIKEIGGVEKPVPIAVSVTGRWILKHPGDLKWLDSLARSGELDIVWINHSYNHVTRIDVPLKMNFMLSPGTDINAEVLNTEIALLQKNIMPSLFFRFPGLVSDHEIYLKILKLGLIPVGSDSWLAKGQWPKDGSIVLIHANGNEPLGVREFIDLLNKKRPEALSRQWELLDLRKSLIDEEKNQH